MVTFELDAENIVGEAVDGKLNVLKQLTEDLKCISSLFVMVTSVICTHMHQSTFTLN